ncbi:MAG: hypothetical protein NC453_00205 [Muribaculum sp.]|nr:hypothetical protein [Muribaculum sp.]
MDSITVHRSQLIDDIIEPLKEASTKAGSGVYLEAELEMPHFGHKGVEVIFNPAVEPYLKSYKTHVSFFNCSKLNGEQYGSNFDDVYWSHWLKPLYKDTDMTLDSIPPTGFFPYTTVFPPEMLNIDDTKNFYFDWGTILCGRLIAFVSVDMKFNYHGKEFDVYETRAYPVTYGYDPGFPATYYHNPPQDVVINFYSPLRSDLEKLYGGDPSRIP